MDASTDQIYAWFVERGFRLAYRSTAIRILSHPDLLDVEVRIGTVYVTVVRDSHEIYRALARDFDPDEVTERVLDPLL